MAKKLKALAEEAGSENQLAAKIKDSANQIWLAGLGAFAKAQAEGGKMFESLVQEGEAMQNKARKTAEETLSEVKSKATGTWDKLEQVFEDRVARALHSLSVPTRKDVDSLARRVAELTKVVEKLTDSLDEQGKKAAAAAKKVA
ncbi:MAG: phasin family protein [Hyphomicrobiales bacterium]|jgi:poly(hydroxyalkanoate) granule-associated protein|nr:phasin family protein [Rhodoblastus sp.]MCC2100545.1 phasin family protein [Hyphomicrobiales bacterium]MCC2104892.1 phasin family protein [Hyphomicrobiales bacterium]MCC2106328.1 phasin family protein [Hyphomicrobiales bacterium]